MTAGARYRSLSLGRLAVSMARQPAGGESPTHHLSFVDSGGTLSDSGSFSGHASLGENCAEAEAALLFSDWAIVILPGSMRIGRVVAVPVSERSRARPV